jgi:hypothetical protein
MVLTTGKLVSIIIATGLLGGLAGAFGYAALTDRAEPEPSPTPTVEATPTPTPTESPLSENSSQSQSDTELIFAAIKKYDGSSGNFSTPKISGSYARTIQTRGLTYYLKKTNGVWKVIAAGNGSPSEDELRQMGVPNALL